MELRLEWDEFVRLSRWIKRNITPEWEPVLVASTFELAVDPDYDIAYEHNRMTNKVYQLDFGYAAEMASAHTTFGQLFLRPMRSYVLDVEMLNKMCQAWMRVAMGEA